MLFDFQFEEGIPPGAGHMAGAGGNGPLKLLSQEERESRADSTMEWKGLSTVVHISRTTP